MDFKPVRGHKRRPPLIKPDDMRRESEPGLGTKLLFEITGLAAVMDAVEGFQDISNARPSPGSQSRLVQNINPRKRLNPKTAFEPR